MANDRWGNCIGMTVEVFPTGAGLGAEIKGVDLSQPLEDAIFTEIETAFDKHGVIIMIEFPSFRKIIICYYIITTYF